MSINTQVTRQKKDAVDRLLTLIINLISERSRHHPGPSPLAIFNRDPISNAILAAGTYEKEAIYASLGLIRVLCKEAPRGGVIDCGANIGNHSLIFAEHFSWVDAYEPIDATFQLLRLNTTDKGNIRAINKAISDHIGVCYIQKSSVNQGLAKIVDQPPNKPTETTSYECTTIDEDYKNSDNISILKLDLEGHESNAILGATNVIRRHMPIILLEANRREIQEGQTTSTRIVRSAGYRIFARIDNATCHPIKLVRVFYLLMTSVGLRRKVCFREIDLLQNQDYDMLVCIHRSKVVSNA